MRQKLKDFQAKISHLDFNNRIGFGGTDQKQIHFKSFELIHTGFLAVCQSNLASFMAAGGCGET